MACHNCTCYNAAHDKCTSQADCLEEEELLGHTALKALGAHLIQDYGIHGIRVAEWSIRMRSAIILKMGAREKLEKMLGTVHLPEMVFGDNSLELVHEATGVKIHFNGVDAMRGWRQESLSPVEVRAAAKWKFRTKPDEQVILDYDYTFTTPYAGSECVENAEGVVNGAVEWVESQERIDIAALQARDPILFFDELMQVVLYEDELADNGISLLTAKVRVMPTCWFLLLRFWVNPILKGSIQLRADGALMRVRDTRMFCRMQGGSTAFPVVIRERSIKEDTFEALASKGYPNDSAMYNGPNVAGERLTVKRHVCEILKLKSSTE